MKRRLGRLGFLRLSLSQVAQRLGVTVRRARQLVVDGPLDGIMSGRRLFVELEALERYRAAAR